MLFFGAAALGYTNAAIPLGRDFSPAPANDPAVVTERTAPACLFDLATRLQNCLEQFGKLVRRKVCIPQDAAKQGFFDGLSRLHRHYSPSLGGAWIRIKRLPFCRSSTNPARFKARTTCRAVKDGSLDIHQAGTVTRPWNEGPSMGIASPWAAKLSR